MAFFEIYKKDQGKYVRWGTVVGIGILVAIGMYWLAKLVLGPLHDWQVTGTPAETVPTSAPAVGSALANSIVKPATGLVISAFYMQTIAVVLFGTAGAWLALWLVNRPRTADFMIMTESEMRKVNWPSRRDTIVNTKVVIVLTLLFGMMLAVVDGGFIWFFTAVGVLSQGK